ncbi:hypothetical protein Q5R05_01930 [Leuconostoc carnosum]|uniref:DNA-binding protein n=1 Tax=Leuconostoc kimchii (strain IMSNU 11154 / KCTC 2386 / IH25) TaxID=762051 RepID=D5T4H5_LEUKI|nr:MULTISPECIES: hypothetical protein [Leuconostoc]ADG41446.1 hypothetical protein LKI_09535 [Leuconostoc kimchii IMSNU 11154]WLC58806.1 hypothetical protein HTZ88_01915 [Leuconostoc carnosum]WLC98145.1 hypothetical protein Q5R05_01930 [Leuconostoc carnosum]SPJ44062.1 conserved hypothetical protein [Leuconostoc carnosum]
MANVIKEEILFFPDLLNNTQLQKMTGYNKDNYSDLVNMRGFPKFDDGSGRTKYPRDGVRQFIKAHTEYNFD